MVAVFSDQGNADAVVTKLAASGIVMMHLCGIDKADHSDEKIVGSYNMGDRVKLWATRAAFWVLHSMAAASPQTVS